LSRRITLLITVPLFMVVAMAQVPASPSSPGAPPPEVVLKSTTRLIQVNVIARDNHGIPVRGLKKEDFEILDNGKPQSISVFSMDSNAVLPQAQPLPENVFTNRLQMKSAVPSSVTVILIDALNTRWQDQAWAKLQVVKYLKTIRPEDRIAIYALGPGLRVLHDFTTDSSSLLKQLDRYNGAILPENEGDNSFGDDLSAMQFDNWMRGAGGVSRQEADFYTINRVQGTLHALEFIANHLASLPGRKNLIWVSGGFPLQIGFGSARAFNDPSREHTSFGPDVSQAIRALNDANVAIYPVDSRGLMADPKFDASNQRIDLRPKLSMGPIVAHQETMSALASGTGGHAYFNTNDLSKAIRDAVDDSSLTYTLGFYPSGDTADGKFHKLDVKAIGHSGLSMHYRKGYFDIADQPRDEHAKHVEIQDAVWSPLDSSALGLLVKVTDAGKDHPNDIDVYIRIDPAGIGTTLNADRRDAAVDVLFIQKNSHGQTFNGEDDTISLAMKPDTFQKIERQGVLYHKVIPKSAQATMLRVIVRDASSGTLGSVTVPFEQLKL